MADVAPKQAREVEVLQRCRALLSFWGDKKLSDVTGRACRDYAVFRAKPVARRELEDLRAAINYHRKEGLCREVVEVTLPDAAPSRDRWLTRSEAARLIWAAWRYREVQKGKETGRRSRQHVARFVLVALYTGTRAGAVCGASLGPVKNGGWIDLERGLFFRRGPDERATKKARPPVQIPTRLLAHLRRWRANGQEHPVEWLGKPVGTGIEKAFMRACGDAGLDDVTPHVLRHTAATWLVANGVPFEKAADFLGMTVETLARVYRHAAPGFQQEAADAITRKPAGSMRSTKRSTI
jgi:integrase